MMFRLAAACVVLAGCSGSAERLEPDQQIGLLDRCAQAQREALAAPEADRARAIDRWRVAIDMGRGLCRNDLHGALVEKDDRTHLHALAVVLQQGDPAERLLAELDAGGRTPEQRARVRNALVALTDQDFGEDRAAWAAWLAQSTDRLVALGKACDEARDKVVAAAPSEREAALQRWVETARRARRRCGAWLSDALIAKADPANRELALELARRLGVLDWPHFTASFTQTLDRGTPEARARAADALVVLTGQDLGDDHAAWKRWLDSAHFDLALARLGRSADDGRSPEEQYARLLACRAARRDAVAWPAHDVARWLIAVQDGGGLCSADLREALLADDRAYEVALEVAKLTDRNRRFYAALAQDIASSFLGTDPQVRAARALEALTGQRLGLNHEPWRRWLAEQSRP